MLRSVAGFIASPETIKVRLYWTLHGRQEFNILHARFSTVGPMNPASAQNIFNTLRPEMPTTIGLALGTWITFDAVGLTDLRNASVPEVKSTGTPVAGASVSTVPTPDQAALVLTLRTSKTGRSHRGRIYTFGYASEVTIADGTVTPAVRTQGVNWGNAIKNALAAEGMTLAIRSPALPDRPAKPGGTLPAKPFELTDVTLIEMRDLIWDTNRRRLDTLRR